MIWGSDPIRFNRFFASQKREDQLWSLNAYQRFFPRSQINLGMKLTVHLCVMALLGISGTIPALPLYALIVWTGKTIFTFHIFEYFYIDPLLACNITWGKLNIHYYWLTEIGCRTLCRLNGVTLLSKFCTHCPDSRRYDPLLAHVCYIINMCLDWKHLPVQSLLSPATFTLPTPTDIYRCSEMDVAGMSFV